MPELPEVELARSLAQDLVGRRVREVHAPDEWWLRRGLDAATLTDAVVGSRVAAVGRRGKLLLIELDGGSARAPGHTIGLHFGMTGRMQVGERWAIEQLEYGSDRDDPRWERFRLVLSGDRARRRPLVLRVVDARRLGGVELDPDLARLGPDALEIDRAALAGVLAAGSAPVKARLLDQSRLAGVGNLVADETLWRAGIDPARAASALDADEVARLHTQLRRTLALLIRRGGSHTGDLQVARFPGGLCPRDGEPLQRRTIGGRTTYSCPVHQR